LPAGATDVGVLFREAMSRLAAGVVMITCEVGGRPWGLTATACCPVSVTPPLILVSLGEATVSAAAIGRSRRFGVSVLGSSAVEAARFASRQGQPKFIDAYCVPANPAALAGTPVVRHAQAHVDCVVNQVHPAGDHTLFIGDVLAVRLNPGNRPLVYCSRQYHGIHQLGTSDQGGTSTVGRALGATAGEVEQPVEDPLAVDA
jgi:flavin reductase (DIM6/NTAB) family NADH-FMN oxidoreductase RutF